MAKDLRSILGEVAEPKPEDEKRAKEKHVVALQPDVEGNKEVPYKATSKKDKSRKADPADGEDDEMYERELSSDEKKKKEEVVKGLKKHKPDFTKRYGKDGESVMHGVATKRAKNESVNEDAAHQDKGSAIMTPGQVETMFKLTQERITGHHLKWDGSVRKKYFDLVAKFNSVVASGAIAGSGKFQKEESELLEAAMTRQHFQKFADGIKNIKDKNDRQRFAELAAGVFADSNPRFDKARFMKAAGASVSEENTMMNLLSKISESKKTKTLVLQNGDKVTVSPDLAESLVYVHGFLCPDNAIKFEETLIKSLEHFNSIVTLAESIGE